MAGFTGSLLLIVSEADLVPPDIGANVTVTACVDPPTLTVKDVGLIVNCSESTPDTAMLDTTNGAFPMLETESVCGVTPPMLMLPNESDAVESEIVGAWAVPDNDTVEGLPVAL